MGAHRRLTGFCLAVIALTAPSIHAQIRLSDESDRLAFRAWFVFLTDAQFYRTSAEVTDCAGLIRYAFREALRAHTPEWQRQANLPMAPALPEIRRRPSPAPHGWPLFRVGEREYAEFADASTIIRLNSRRLGSDLKALHPGDLLYFRQSSQAMADHLMVFVGASRFESGAADWVVYHTGPIDGRPGEVRKTRLADLVRHPLARWRPLLANPAFIGVFRLNIL